MPQASAVPCTGVSVADEQALGVYASSDWAERVFCSTCGVRSFARGAGEDGVDMYAINVRCLDDVDPATLAIHNFDGKSL